MKEEDKVIKDVFESLAKETKAKAPNFDTIWGNAQRSKRRKISSKRIFTIAATIIILLALGTSFLFQKSCKSEPSNRAKYALLEWEAPTDLLLKITTSSSGNKIFRLPTDQLLDWQIDENELLNINSN